jgi:hypothetical protein
MTPCEWAFYMEGYRQREEEAWLRTRTIYTLMYNINVDKHHQMLPAELMPLPCDERNEKHREAGKAKYLTDEEREKIIALYKARC